MNFKGLLILLLFSITGIETASTQDTFTKSAIVEASADKVWSKLRQLDGLEEIAPQLLSDSWIHDNARPGVGCERSCSAPGMPKGQAAYTEKITQYSDAERFYEYKLISGTPTVNMVNSIRVTDLGYQKCMVTWTSQREAFVKNDQMTEEQFNAFLSTAGQTLVDGVAQLYASK